MHITVLALLAATGVTLAQVNNEHLKTEVLTSAECTRKTQRGDTIQVHYRGTLEKDGSEFDASYNRGTPFEFSVGKGQVLVLSDPSYWSLSELHPTMSFQLAE